MKAIPPDLALEYNKKHNEKQSQVTDLTTYLRGEVESRERTEILLKPHGSHSYPNKYSGRAPPIYPQPNRKGQGHSRFYPSHKSGVRASANELLSAAVSNCLFCSEDTHASDMCENLCVQEKRAKLIKEGRCFLCCYTCCHVKKCKKEVCSYCKGRHARAICFKLENSLKQNSHIDLEKGKVDVKPMSSNSVLHNRGGVLLQCVKAEVIGHISSDKIICLFDNGSEKSFIKKNVSRRLGLKKVGSERLNIFSFGCKTPKKQTCSKVEVRLRNILNGEITVIEALEIEEISKATLSLPSPDVWTEMETKGFRLTFNCSESSENCEISLLIGSDFYWSLTHRIKRLDSSLVAVETSLGWSLQGKCDEQSDCTSVHLIHSEEESISAELRRFWEIESLGIRDNDSVSLGNGDEEILSEFDKSVCFVDGRYRVSLPWKPGMREVLQNNKTVARKRFEGLVRRFKCDHELFCEYKDVIDNYVREAFTADVKSAFLQIELDLRDREFTRFFWTDNLNNNPYVLNFTRVPFGLRPSPYLLAATLKHHFKKYKEQYPHTFDLLNSSIYVDDFICGRNDVPEALHASKSAYGTILYLRFVTCNNKIETSFICSKSRVAPLKSLTLPRLELTAAILSARLAKQVSSCLKFNANIYYWTDSLISYYWIRGDSSAFKPYIKNHVQEIQLLSDPSQWGHCPGKDNPSDLILRGTSAVKLAQNELWWHGPPWLKLTPDHWPNRHRDILDSELCSEELEYRSSVHVAVTQQWESLVDINRFSSLKKLLKILTLKRNEQLRCSSEIKSLVPYLGEDNLLRITGRLLEADLCFGEKHPVILPRHCKFTELLVIREHERIGHCGVSATLTQLRKTYWIPKGRQLVKTIIRIYLICKKYNAKPADQLSGQLPRDRITQSPPFQIVGIDFTVLVEGNVKSKLLWELGIIKEIFIGRDNNVRSCLVKTSKGLFKKPIQLLYPLELE
ncbi:integrase catalytic domain-containing protein [Trichonephila clavata]|uniref:Integrase catalytic domain-containing protein n=1 Tax=Trichonephila clavata TaxID=2740835 RepID=A0A8X6KKF5_TRICU|nr:integrase catalytic domain-containing protein [Trichonephila clavata]